MTSNIESRLSTLEALVRAQGDKIEAQARTIAELEDKGRVHRAVACEQERAIVDLSRNVFQDGEWVEDGTVRRRIESGARSVAEKRIVKKWNWQSYKARPVNFWPRLPEEVMVMILRLCDPAQLSSLCEVSYLFLVRASSLLYREIRLNGRQATKLFGRRTESARVAGARINGCLSLQRTRKITLDSGAKRYPIAQDPAPEAIEVFEDRFVQEDTNAFRLDSLTLRTVQPTADLVYWRPLLNLLDPIHVKIYGEARDQWRNPKACAVSTTDLPFLHRWTQLESVTSVGAVVFVTRSTPNQIAIKPTVLAGVSCHLEYQIHKMPVERGAEKAIEVLHGDEKQVLEVLRKRRKEEVGRRTYLRVMLVEDKLGVADRTLGGGQG